MVIPFGFGNRYRISICGMELGNRKMYIFGVLISFHLYISGHNTLAWLYGFRICIGAVYKVSCYLGYTLIIPASCN
jgi:hypothetical protein